MKASTTQKKLVQSIAANCLSVRLRLMNRKIGAIYDEALRSHRIRASQLNILIAVSVSGKVTSQQLCRRLHMDPSTFSRALARMKRNQWLQVEPSGEGKILNVMVTKKGYKKIESVYPDWQRAQIMAVEALGKSTSDIIITSGTKQLKKV